MTQEQHRAVLEKDEVKFHFLWTSAAEDDPVYVTRRGPHNNVGPTREYTKAQGRKIWSSLVESGFACIWKGDDFSPGGDWITRDLTMRRTVIGPP